MAITVVSAAATLALVLKDRENEFMSAVEYESFLLGYCQKETTLQLQKLRSNYWKLWGGAGVSAVFGPTDASSGLTTSITTGVLTCAVADPNGGCASFAASAGTDNSEQLALVACQLDFAAACEALLMFVSTQRAEEYAQSVGGGSINPITARKELQLAAEIWRGIRAA